MHESVGDARKENKTAMAKCPANHGFYPLNEPVT